MDEVDPRIRLIASGRLQLGDGVDLEALPARAVSARSTDDLIDQDRD